MWFYTKWLLKRSSYQKESSRPNYLLKAPKAMEPKLIVRAEASQQPLAMLFDVKELFQRRDIDYVHLISSFSLLNESKTRKFAYSTQRKRVAAAMPMQPMPYQLLGLQGLKAHELLKRLSLARLKKRNPTTGSNANTVFGTTSFIFLLVLENALAWTNIERKKNISTGSKIERLDALNTITGSMMATTTPPSRANG